jgi:hypothetical protein
MPSWYGLSGGFGVDLFGGRNFWDGRAYVGIGGGTFGGSVTFSVYLPGWSIETVVTDTETDIDGSFGAGDFATYTLLVPSTGGGGIDWGWWRTFGKTLVTKPSTGAGSCLAVFTDASKKPLQLAGTAARTIQQNAAGLQGLSIVATNWAGSLDANAMRTSVLAAGGTTTAALTANAVTNIGLANASRAVAAAVPKVPVAFLGAVDVILAIAVGKEAYAAATGQCHP